MGLLFILRLDLSSSATCHAIASPSLSGSVARYIFFAAAAAFVIASICLELRRHADPRAEPRTEPRTDTAVIVLWLSEDGRMLCAVRDQRRWQALHTVLLPGPGMQQIELSPPASRLAPESAEREDELASGRYSRQAGALGAAVLARMQAATFAVVGAGRTGSVLAHTLVRAGASVMLIDPDRVAQHNLDGDVLPQHEGLGKADAVARYLRAISRPGAHADPRTLDIADPVCGSLLVRTDAVISCVDDDRARLWAAVWCAALLKPHLDIGVAARPGRLGADLRLTLPGSSAGAACLACLGGFADAQRLPLDTPSDQPQQWPDFRQQRAGSLRSWGSAAAHLGLRMVEALFAGTGPGSMFRRLDEDGQGRLTTRDDVAGSNSACPLCQSYTAVGRRAVSARGVHALARVLRNGTMAGAVA